MNKRIAIALTATAVLSASVSAGVQAHADEADTPSCYAQVIAYEDGSWAGGTVWVDGKVWADRWYAAEPSEYVGTPIVRDGLRVWPTTFVPSVNWQDCSLFI